MPKSTNEKLQALTAVIRTVHRLRAPGGCPWDMKQTHQSLRQYLIEEAYEVLDVVDQIGTVEDLKKPQVSGAFREELGDLLMQVLLHAEMASETGAFDFYDVAQSLDEKLIRRHPHVFGDVKVDGEEGVLQNWEKIKAQEKAAKSQSTSCLDGMPKGLPALQKAARVLERVTKVGFQWNDMHGPLGKVEEELAEMKGEVLALEAFISKNGKDADASALRKKLEGEIGDLLFTLCNVSYLMKVSPEDALRSTLARFESRFRFVEGKLREKGKTPEQSDLKEMDQHWDEAKAIERAGKN
jgi:tetrapyrrole methylase family protein/MazG family protein